MLKAWLLERLKEPSTYRGIALLLSAAGIGVAPEAIYQIGSALVGVFGAIEVARKEK